MFKKLLFILGAILPLGLSATLADEVKAPANVIALCNPPLNKLEEIVATLKAGDMVTISYLPKESQHWRLLDRVLHGGLPESIASMYEYREQIERMGLKLISAEQKHDFAFYASREKLIEEIQKNPAIWPIPLNAEQIERLVDFVESYSLPLESGDLNFPYTMINFVIQK
jgi:hypothetical protein